MYSVSVWSASGGARTKTLSDWRMRSRWEGWLSWHSAKAKIWEMRLDETSGGLVRAVILSRDVVFTMDLKEAQAELKADCLCFCLLSPIMARKAGLREGRWPYPSDREDPVMKRSVGWREYPTRRMVLSEMEVRKSR